VTESFFGLKGHPSVVQDVEIHNQPVLQMRQKIYTVKPVLRGHIGTKKLNSYAIFYDRTRKR
jgi:hypothetical protein